MRHAPDPPAISVDRRAPESKLDIFPTKDASNKGIMRKLDYKSYSSQLPKCVHLLLFVLILFAPQQRVMKNGVFVGSNVGVLCFATPSLHPATGNGKGYGQINNLTPKLDVPRRSRLSLAGSSSSAAVIDHDQGGEGAGLHSTSSASITVDSLATNGSTQNKISFWPSGDALDQRLIRIALPCIANFAINPLIGAVDLFWINRMGNPLAVAGQAAANQVFNSAFWLTSFLPSVTATLVAKESAKKSIDGIQDAVGQALIVGFVMALLGSYLILSRPEQVLSTVLNDGAPAMQYAKPYLMIRGLAFLPSLVSLIGFSAFRGVMDTVTPLKISLIANLFNIFFDPILIFKAKMGVTGAALSALTTELISALSFTYILRKRLLIRWSKLFKLPSWSKLAPLLRGGLALQLRNFSLNVTFLAVTRVTQGIDTTGVAAAAHAMAIQTFQVGGIVLLALSTVAQTIVPSELIERVDPVTGTKNGGILACKAAVNRLMSWGLILGALLGAVQILLLPFLFKVTPLIEVREAALVPSYLASAYQIMNGLVFIGEGVMIGCGNFMQLSFNTLLATLGTLLALRTFPATYGLTGIWMSFGVFNTIRLIGVALHQLYYGPIAERKITASQNTDKR